jgi:hypothetical protein
MRTVASEHYQYIHNIFGCFVNSMAEFFSTELYPDTKEVVIGTYHKAIQHYKKFREEGGENHTLRYPLLIFDPMLDFEPEEFTGRFFHAYPNYSQKKLAAKLWGPAFYKDDNIEITPVLNRYKGTFQVSVLCRSVYEAIDLKFLTLQFFGGKDRIIYPKNVNGYFILPNSFLYHEYNNPYTEETYTLDWENYKETVDLDPKAELILIKTINQEKWVYPFSIQPWLILRDVSDGGEKYGGEDLSEYRLVMDIEWECNLPTHLVMISDMQPNQSPRGFFEIHTDIAYKDHYGNPIEDTTIHIHGNDENDIASFDLQYLIRWEYLVTADDVSNINSGQNIAITLPREVTSNEYVVLFRRTGKMERAYEYTHTPPSDEVTLINISLNGKLTENEIITIVVYTKT